MLYFVAQMLQHDLHHLTGHSDIHQHTDKMVIDATCKNYIQACQWVDIRWVALWNVILIWWNICVQREWQKKKSNQWNVSVRRHVKNTINKGLVMDRLEKLVRLYNSNIRFLRSRPTTWAVFIMQHFQVGVPSHIMNAIEDLIDFFFFFLDVILWTGSFYDLITQERPIQKDLALTVFHFMVDRWRG